MISWEIKKIIKSKSIIAVSILFVLLVLSMSFMKPNLDTEYSYIDDKGNYIEDKRPEEVIASEKLLNKVDILKEMGSKENLNSKDKTIKKVAIMSNEKLNIDNGKEYKDISFYKVFNFRINNIFSSLIIMAIIIIIFSNIYTDEKLSNVDSVILSSKNKNKALYSKLLLSTIVPIAIYVIYLLIIGIITSIQYGVPINGNLQAYRISDIPSIIDTMSINMYTVVNILTMILIFVSISVFSSISSYIAQSSVGAVVGSVIFIVVGKVLTLFKFLPKEILMILGLVNYIDIVQQPESYIGVYKGSFMILGNNVDINLLSYTCLIGLLLIGILSTIYILKKVIDK